MFHARFLLALFILHFWTIGQTLATTKCTSYSSHWLEKTVSFCIERTRPELDHENEPVIYFLHGLGGNQTTWSKGGYSEALSELTSKDPNFPALTFVSFETEMDSFFSDFEGRPEGSKAYESWFLNDFIPFIEEKYDVCKTQNCRGVAGVSMGGFGALKFALKFQHLFSLGAANSPALPPFSIHESNEEWKDYFSNTKIGVTKGMLLLRDVRKIFPTEELYQLNNPNALVENSQNSQQFPKLYFDVGSEDNFGFQVGYQIFKETLDLAEKNYSAAIEEGGDHFIYHHRNRNLIEFIKEWAVEIK